MVRITIYVREWSVVAFMDAFDAFQLERECLKRGLGVRVEDVPA